MNMIELEQMRREWVTVTRKNGFREGITDLLAHQYSKRTHFIFELLQNAEDAGATEVEFRVEDERLVFSHNGDRLFSDENVESITSIGKSTKQTDYTQIGKHGIGFKAVFAYTHTPRIHSGDKHFDIEDVVIPCLLTCDDTPPDLKPGETRIILPFDSDAIPEVRRFREFVSAEKAKADISDALKKLNIRTLLFLHHIEKIRWTLVDGTEGVYLRKSKSEPERIFLRHVDVTDGDRTESWLIFEQEVNVTDDGKDNKCIVEVAFLVENGKVIPARNTELVVYFPTEKKTGMAFLIQGPFKTTKARNNIKFDDPANQQMLETAAHLAANSLETLRDLKFLDVSSYLALPLQIPDDGYFRPVYDNVREVLREKPLLPANGGGFITAEEAKLARGKDLTELFSPEQLSKLFGKQKVSWLDPSITETGSLSAFHAYLVGRKQNRWSSEWEIEPLTEGLEVNAESLAQRLNQEFLATQHISWLIIFIQYVVKNPNPFKEKKVPFIRLEKGEHVSLPTKGYQPLAYLPPKDDGGLNLSTFRVVERQLSEHKEIREFLEKEYVPVIDDIAIVVECILPKYCNQDGEIKLEEHWRDIEKIVQAYKTASQEKQRRLKGALQSTAFILEQQTPEPEKPSYRSPNVLYSPIEELKTYFSGNPNVGFVSLNYKKFALECFEDLGVSDEIRISCKSRHGSEGFVKLEYKNGYRRGLKGFDPNIRVDGLENAIRNPSTERSKIIWNNIAVKHSHCIKGKVLRSSRQDFSPNASTYKEEETISDFGNLLINTEWLPGLDGKFHKPSDLTLDDLPFSFEKDTPHAKFLSLALEMKQPEREQALEVVTGGDPDLKRLIEHYQSAPEAEREKILKIIPHEIQPEPAPSFKDGLKNLGRPQRGIIEYDDKERSPVSNHDRYQEKLNERVEAEVEGHQSTPRKITFSPVRDHSSNAEARNFLYEQYNGYCQVTGTTFPKASRKANGKAENYFEACTLLSYGNADYLNNAGNMLCLSADTMAKFKHASVEFLENLEDVIEKFKANGKSSGSVFVRIRLAGEERSIKWSQRHFMRLVALYEIA